MQTPDKSPPSSSQDDSLPLEFSRQVCPAQLQSSETTELNQTATPEECAAVATRAGLLGARHLMVHAEISPYKKGWKLSGVVQAEVARTCVLSLEPFTAVLSSDFEIEVHHSESNADIDEDIMSDETDTEVLVDGCFDLGEIAVQYLCLALDDHPRNPDRVEDLKAHSQQDSSKGYDLKDDGFTEDQLEATESPLASALKAAQKEKAKKKATSPSR